MRIPVFFAFNNDYTVPAAVAFWSLLNKSKKENVYELYVLHNDITEDNQNLLKDIVQRFRNASLSFIYTDGFMSEEFNNGTFQINQAFSKFSKDTLVRCFAPRFFPQFDKIIYSDVDVVFMDDISDLWDMNIQNNYFAGVLNPFMKYSPEELSHLSAEHYEMLKNSYIAGGIWIMNLKKIREDNLEQIMMSIVQDNTIEKRWNDQDVVNIASKGNVFHIPLNFISYPHLPTLLQEAQFVSHYSRDQLYDSIINPKILHYAASKPWNNEPSKAEIWWEIFNFLQLPKTRIFKDVSEKKELRLKVEKYSNKLTKYKRNLYQTIIVGVLLLVIEYLILY